MCNNPHGYRIPPKPGFPSEAKCVMFRHPNRIGPQVYGPFKESGFFLPTCRIKQSVRKDVDQRGYKKEISMKTRLFVARGLFAVALLALAGFAIGAPAARAASSKAVDNSPIADQVRHKLLMQPWYGVFDNLEYQVNGREGI